MTQFYTYIIYTGNDVLHSIGTTIDLHRRMELVKQQCKKELSFKLVYYEVFDDSCQATQRENEFIVLHPDVLHELVIQNNPMLINLYNSERNEK